MAFENNIVKEIENITVDLNNQINDLNSGDNELRICSLLIEAYNAFEEAKNSFRSIYEKAKPEGVWTATADEEYDDTIKTAFDMAKQFSDASDSIAEV